MVWLEMAGLCLNSTLAKKVFVLIIYKMGIIEDLMGFFLRRNYGTDAW